MRTTYCHRHRRATCPACAMERPGAQGAAARGLNALVALWWTTVVLTLLVGAVAAVARAAF